MGLIHELGERADASDVPVWIEADELRDFGAWWETQPATQRKAWRAFLHRLQSADRAWSAVCESQCRRLEKAQRSIRRSDEEVARFVPPSKNSG